MNDFKKQARRKDWPAGEVDKLYSLENLNPNTVYDLR